jgi:Ser/Thr protein kinase RdoA (MazF antagonist)
VKWVPDRWRDEATAEARGLAHLRGRTRFDTPALLAVDRIDSWTALVMTRVPGRPLPFRGGDPAVCRQVGVALASLHTLPRPARPPRAESWPTFFGRQQHVAATAQARRGLQPHLVAEIPALVGALRTTAERAFLHADLHHQHVLLTDGVMTGWIDFADARIGDPLFDVVTPAVFLAPDHASLRDLLRGARLLHRVPSRRDMLGWVLLHPFAHLRRYLGDARPTSLAHAARLLWP